MTGNSKQAGFTLVEVLIATMVMSVVMVLASNLLLLFFTSQDTSRDTLYLEAEVRQILSRIVETSRESLVDYSFYTATPSDEPTLLAFRSPEGIQTVYWFYTNLAATTADIYVCDNMPFDDSCDKTVNPSSSTEWSRMNDSQTNFVLGSFTVSPDTSPYVSSATTPTDQAPLITITAQLQLSDGSTQSSVIQTTVTPRIYDR